MQNQISRSEIEIGRLEKEIKTTEEILIQPEKFKDKVLGPQFYKEYERLKELLEKEIKKWEELHNDLEELGKKKPD